MNEMLVDRSSPLSDRSLRRAIDSSRYAAKAMEGRETRARETEISSGSRERRKRGSVGIERKTNDLVLGVPF